MRESFALGHIAGIRIGVNWSVLFIFTVIALGLAGGRLPAAHPGHPWPLYIAVGLVTAVVFFGSLLAHELAHAVVARGYGVPVEGIVLWLFGGVARMGQEAPNPRAELRIAGVGPLVSLALGVIFAGFAWLLAGLTGVTLATEAVAWLAGINILLALFNSLPAAPLDGGRLLRAFLWWRTGDRLRAVQGASTAGKVMGWALMLLGLYAVLLGAAFSGLWLVLIGGFILAAATAEASQAQVRDVLSGVPVRDVMSPDPVVAPPGLRLEDFLRDPPAGYRHQSFPVVDEDTPVGLLTLDRVREVVAEGRESALIGDIMLPLSETLTAGPADSVADILPRMEGDTGGRVLVLDDGGRLVGIVSPSDINRAIAWLMSTLPREGAARRTPP
ncbi:site-2 protease family protein [Streptomyces gobiensis]|uniref:site-2 protease family protein n=1 Tax=Streptomyces gobiensis TaxID=2875706 RepID=UPI001E2C26CF|nr:site-2 protease family protein [Streptomyces gobiensis]UGY93550.1 site-2 protease family protein [Streptomyces gobiensis]